MQKYYINSAYCLSVIFLLRIINVQCVHIDENNVQYINNLLFQRIHCISIRYNILHKLLHKYTHMLIIGEYDSIYTYQCMYTIVLIYCRDNGINIHTIYYLMCDSDIYADSNIYIAFMRSLFCYSVSSVQKYYTNYLSIYSLIHSHCRTILKYKKAILNILQSQGYSVNIHDVHYLLSNSIDK